MKFLSNRLPFIFLVVGGAFLLLAAAAAAAATSSTTTVSIVEGQGGDNQDEVLPRRLTADDLLAAKQTLAPFEDALLRAFGLIGRNKMKQQAKQAVKEKHKKKQRKEKSSNRRHKKATKKDEDGDETRGISSQGGGGGVRGVTTTSSSNENENGPHIRDLKASHSSKYHEIWEDHHHDQEEEESAEVEEDAIPPPPPTNTNYAPWAPETATRHHELKGSRSSKGSSSKSKSKLHKPEPEQWTQVNYGDELTQCKAELDHHDAMLKTCVANATEPSFLFVQMAKQCTISKDANTGKYYLSSKQFSPDTWVFTDRPITHEETEPTKDFFTNFGEVFQDSKPNAAVTFVSENMEQFKGPLVAVFLDAVVQESDDTYKYEISQSDDQAAVGAIDSFLANGASTASFADCSFFIDNARGTGGSNCHTAKQRLKYCLSRPDKQASGCPHWVQNCHKYCKGSKGHRQCQHIINNNKPTPPGSSYCTNAPDYTCYYNGYPACCANNPRSCPAQRPACERPPRTPSPYVPPPGSSYCTYAPDYTCYYNGLPACCTNNPWSCPSAQPACDTTAPGSGYCTWAPDNNCYTNGWPSCCGKGICPLGGSYSSIEANGVQWCCPPNSNINTNNNPPCVNGVQPSTSSSSTCPAIQPPCDKTISGNTYCTWAPDNTCYINGWPACCTADGPNTNTGTSCPQVQPPCDTHSSDYCTGSQSYSCYPNTRGYPSCCQSQSASCPRIKPACGQ